ncbi:MAG: hypothetical protein ABW101_12245 [Candidatus Thiodiazotropha sp.]
MSDTGMRVGRPGGFGLVSWFPGFRCAAPRLQYDKAQPGVARVKQRVTRGNLARV